MQLKLDNLIHRLLNLFPRNCGGSVAVLFHDFPQNKSQTFSRLVLSSLWFMTIVWRFTSYKLSLIKKSFMFIHCRLQPAMCLHNLSHFVTETLSMKMFVFRMLKVTQKSLKLKRKKKWKTFNSNLKFWENISVWTYFINKFIPLKSSRNISSIFRSQTEQNGRWFTQTFHLRWGCNNMWQLSGM